MIVTICGNASALKSDNPQISYIQSNMSHISTGEDNSTLRYAQLQITFWHNKLLFTAAPHPDISMQPIRFAASESQILKWIFHQQRLISNHLHIKAKIIFKIPKYANTCIFRTLYKWLITMES